MIKSNRASLGALAPILLSNRARSFSSIRHPMRATDDAACDAPASVLMSASASAPLGLNDATVVETHSVEPEQRDRSVPTFTCRPT